MKGHDIVFKCEQCPPDDNVVNIHADLDGALTNKEAEALLEYFKLVHARSHR